MYNQKVAQSYLENSEAPQRESGKHRPQIRQSNVILHSSTVNLEGDGSDASSAIMKYDHADSSISFSIKESTSTLTQIIPYSNSESHDGSLGSEILSESDNALVPQQLASGEERLQNRIKEVERLLAKEAAGKVQAEKIAAAATKFYAHIEAENLQLTRELKAVTEALSASQLAVAAFLKKEAALQGRLKEIDELLALEAAGKADVEAKAGAAAKAREKEVALRRRLNEVERLLATAHSNDTTAP
jgi:hypothetical protein